MKPEDLLNVYFFKQFKNSLELISFLEEPHKRGVEQLLEGKLDACLDYEKHQKSKSKNLRNAHNKKKPKPSLGEAQILVPRDRDNYYNPMFVKKRKSPKKDIDNIIIPLYAKDMSHSNIEEQNQKLYDFNIPILRITNKITEDAIAWRNRTPEVTCLDK